MIFVDKKTVEFPECLLLQIPDGTSSQKRRKIETTLNRRQEILNNGSYINTSTYNSRYKHNDIKRILEKLYNNKCAFCERVMERWDVEHFRPKAIYYWLAFSWDNLLFSCPTCNGHKKANFDVETVAGHPSPDQIAKIHELADEYFLLEKPKMIHPEKEEEHLKDLWTFDENGNMLTDDERGAYTIDTIKLNRKRLRDDRKRCWKRELIKRYNSILAELNDGLITEDEANANLRFLLRTFILDSKDAEVNFTAFRQFAAKNFL